LHNYAAACPKTEIAPPQIYRITSETKMSITTTINKIAFTFELDADEHWNIYAEHNFIEYVARDAKFTPLKTSTAAQIQELLKYDGQWEWFVAKNDKGVESRNIMLWWFVPLLDMKIIVQLEKKQTSIAEDVEVRFKMQEKQIAELQAEHKTELTKLRDEHTATVKKLVKDFSAEIVKLQSQFDRMALRNKRMVIHFEMQGDKLKVSYEDKSPEATRAYNAYMEYMKYFYLSYDCKKKQFYYQDIHDQNKTYYHKMIPTVIERIKKGSKMHNLCYYMNYTIKTIPQRRMNVGYSVDETDPFDSTLLVTKSSGVMLDININYRKFEFKQFDFGVINNSLTYEYYQYYLNNNTNNQLYSYDLDNYIKFKNVYGVGMICHMGQLSSPTNYWMCVIIYKDRIMDE
jgi:hypothetical protein